MSSKETKQYQQEDEIMKMMEDDNGNCGVDCHERSKKVEEPLIVPSLLEQAESEEPCIGHSFNVDQERGRVKASSQARIRRATEAPFTDDITVKSHHPLAYGEPGYSRILQG